MKLNFLKYSSIVVAIALASGCTGLKEDSADYSMFKKSRPRSILVLPPINKSTDVQASYSFESQVTYPLAEAGYYVMPIALVEETFRQNGMNQADDIHSTNITKLHQIFGADAALYINITDYGTRYLVISSETIVTANAKLVDLKTGATLWTGSARASSEEGNNEYKTNGLVATLISAAVKQVINSSIDKAHPIAGVTSNRLLSAGRRSGILYGPRSPKYASD